MALDERLRDELERAARPADPSGLYEDLIRRRERRRIVRKVQSGLLAVVVIVGSLAGVYGLSRVFGERRPQTAAPADGAIALTIFSDHPPTHRIALVDPAGTGLRFLTTGDHIDTLPAWSPDGSRLAFWRVDQGNARGLWVMDADGSDARVLYETDASIGAIGWSPDGSRIAFINIVIPEGPATELDLSDDLYVVNTDGTDVTPLITDGHITDFDWSPDGTSLVIERLHAIGEDRLGYDLAIVDVDASGERPITSDAVSSDPTWSPDGSSIVYVGSASGEFRDRDLFAISPDGTGRVQLTDDEGTEEDPVFSPDGSLVAYTRFPHGDGSACELVVMKPDGSAARTIATKETLGGCPVGLAWQPLPVGEEVSPQPSPSPLPSESPAAEGPQNIGLGFPVCNVTSVSGVFAPGVSGTAFVATKTGDVGCPELGDGLQVVAVDVSGDGLADVDYGPLTGCDPWCSAFAAPDVDGDGTDELLIQNIQFSIAGLRLYEVRADPPKLFPVTVSSPGYPEGGLAPGAEPQLWIGADGFNLDSLRCVADEGRRVLVQTSASQVPPDTADSVWRATATWFSLDPDGTVSIVDVGTFDEPFDENPSFAQGNGVCGARLPGNG